MAECSMEELFGVAKDLSEVGCDYHLERLGYECVGHVCELPRFRDKNVFYRLWCWVRGEEDMVATLDLGNRIRFYFN